jgi:hypothetical protein
MPSSCSKPAAAKPETGRSAGSVFGNDYKCADSIPNLVLFFCFINLPGTISKLSVDIPVNCNVNLGYDATGLPQRFFELSLDPSYS